MDGQRIRPSLRDLASHPDYDQLAFPEIEGAASVTRARPPPIQSAKVKVKATARTIEPSPVPSIPLAAAAAAAVPEPSKLKPKPKSRFALQREREQAERLAASATGSALEPSSIRSEIINMPKLIGEVVERYVDLASAALPTAPSTAAPSLPRANDSTGFPPSSHLLFPRKSSATSTKDSCSDITPTPVLAEVEDPDSVPALLASVSDENERLISTMSEQEILEQQREVRESMGLSDDLLRILDKRAQRRREEAQAPSNLVARAPSSLSSSSRAPLAATSRSVQGARGLDDETEGSPEYIRKHFFPHEPVNSNLDWMKASSDLPDEGESVASAWTFDLHGALLSTTTTAGQAPIASTSHHVSSSSTFTVGSLMALTGSSVAAQRSTALSVLLRILGHSSRHEQTFGNEAWRKLQLDAMTRATGLLRDANVSVLSAALDLLAHVLRSQCDRPPLKIARQVPGAEPPATVLSTFLAATPFPAFVHHLAQGMLPPSAMQQILDILVSVVRLVSKPPAASYSDLEPLFATPELLETVVKRFIAIPWPLATSSSRPSSASVALSLLSDLARSSRTHAKALCSRKLVEPSLRFLGVAPWELGDVTPSLRQSAYDLVRLTFELWHTLGRYGLGTSLRTIAASLLPGFIEHVTSALNLDVATVAEDDIELGMSLLRLLSIWTVAAVDPHVTEHDILWSHIEGWEEIGLQAHRWGMQNRRWSLVTGAWNLWAEWIEGSKVNSAWKAEKERTWIKECVSQEFRSEGQALRAVLDAIERLTDGTSSDVEGDSAFVLAGIRLSSAYEEDSEPSTSALFYLDGQLVMKAFDELIPRLGTSMSDSKSLVRLLVLLLRHVPTTSIRFRRTVDVLRLLRAGDEVAARDLIEWIIRVVHPYANHSMAPLSDLDARLELPALSNAAILRPFLLHALVTAGGGRVTGPLHPTPRDLKLTASLHPFAPSRPLMPSDWPLVALDELLRSGTSPVFANLPSGWDSTELEVVRASLALMRIVFIAGEPGMRIDPRTLLFDLIKIFMLEKEDPNASTSGAAASTSVTDLFRHDGVQFSMRALLGPFSVSAHPQQRFGPDHRPTEATLEGTSSSVSSAPFYQLYTDLVGLYDSVSLGDALFSLVLLPPLAMAYPIDYRRLLWVDYAHLLRQITTNVSEVVSDRHPDNQFGLASWLEPAETDLPMLGAYADAISSGRISKEWNAFLFLVASHHLSRALFGSHLDLAGRNTLARGLMKKASREVMKDLIGYEQVSNLGEELVWTDEVWAAQRGDGWKARWEILRGLVGETGDSWIHEESQ